MLTKWPNTVLYIVYVIMGPQTILHTNITLATLTRSPKEILLTGLLLLHRCNICTASTYLQLLYKLKTPVFIIKLSMHILSCMVLELENKQHHLTFHLVWLDVLFLQWRRPSPSHQPMGEKQDKITSLRLAGTVFTYNWVKIFD